ncbi:hypothetical protein [Lentzea sp. E54]|uniref:hypothetical protein n=1 Tax=Lentzea xerophila TaxID=3435883 RepID=UPI003DA2621A
MDPNAALESLRQLVVKAHTGWDHFSEDDQDELIEKLAGLDEWLTNGGFLPEAWSRFRWQRLNERARQHEAERDANPASIKGSVENQLAGAYRNAIKLAGLTKLGG